jgi:hypothetical protein
MAVDRTSPVETQHPAAASTKRLTGISWRSIILGAFLIPPNAYWVMMVEGIYHRGHPSVMALPWNVVSTVLALVIINQLLKRYVPRFSFTQPELITVYVMVWVVTMLAGHDSLQLGIPALAFTSYFGDDSNRWNDLFTARLPEWLTVKDKTAIKSFFTGYDSFYKPEYVQAWLGPILWWTSFICAMAVVTICANIILRKQWAENERLSFPVVQLPMAITRDGGSGEFWKNKFLWIGIAIGATIDLLNGLHMLYPSVPYIQVRHDAVNLADNLRSHPWNGIGWLPLPLYPFIIAMGYMLPLDMSFSIWFFYLFRKTQNVFFTAYPVVTNPTPYFAMQSFGAWVVYFAFALWMAKGHLKAVWLRITDQPGGADDSEEPVSYRVALLGILLGLAYLVWFTRSMGMSPAAVVGVWGIYFLITMAIVRMRAELGPPAHEMAQGMDAGAIMTMIVGSRALGPTNIALLPLFYWFVGRGYRTNIGPGQLEGFKMAYEAKASPLRLGWAMLIAFLIGSLATYWASLALQYSQPPQPGSEIGHGWGQWLEAADRMNNPSGPDVAGILFFVGAALFTAFLFFMRSIAAWWPFHPAGYALSMAFGVEYFWSCLLIASILKWVTLRFGGLRGYRRFLPIAFGIIIGEFMIGAMWSVISIRIGQFIYDFSPG